MAFIHDLIKNCLVLSKGRNIIQSFKDYYTFVTYINLLFSVGK